MPILPPTDRTKQQSWCCPADCQSSLVVVSSPNQLDFFSCHCYSLILHTYHNNLLLVFRGYAGVGDYINVGRVFCGRHSWPALRLSKTLTACRAENFVLLVCVCVVCKVLDSLPAGPTVCCIVVRVKVASCQTSQSQQGLLLRQIYRRDQVTTTRRSSSSR